MLAALDAGVTLPGLALSAGKGTRPDDVQRFLDRIGPVLAPARRPANPRRIVIDGAGATAAPRCWRSSGMRVRTSAAPSAGTIPFVDAADAAVIVGRFALAPERHRPLAPARHPPPARSCSATRRSASVRSCDPGSGPCLVCIDLHRADEDAGLGRARQPAPHRHPRRETRWSRRSPHARRRTHSSPPSTRVRTSARIGDERLGRLRVRPAERTGLVRASRCGASASAVRPGGTTSSGTTATARRTCAAVPSSARNRDGCRWRAPRCWPVGPAEVQPPACAGDPDVEQPPLLVDLLEASSRS